MLGGIKFGTIIYNKTWGKLFVFPQQNFDIGFSFDFLKKITVGIFSSEDANISKSY